MKKMMMITALSALAAGAMAQSEQIDSGNILGYAKLNLGLQDNMMFGAVFKDIVAAQKELDIQSIDTNIDDGTGSLLWWSGVDWVGNQNFDGVWWELDDETYVMSTKVFAVGEGFRFECGTPNAYVTVRGELYTSTTNLTEIPLTLREGIDNEMFVNPMPVSVELQDIGTNIEDGTGSLLWWSGVDWVENRNFDGDWWELDDETYVMSTKVFEVGEGFRFECGTPGAYLTFKNPLVEIP